jgi:hypothetical protein
VRNEWQSRLGSFKRKGTSLMHKVRHLLCSLPAVLPNRVLACHPPDSRFPLRYQFRINPRRPFSRLSGPGFGLDLSTLRHGSSSTDSTYHDCHVDTSCTLYRRGSSLPSITTQGQGRTKDMISARPLANGKIWPNQGPHRWKCNIHWQKGTIYQSTRYNTHWQQRCPGT